MYWFCFVDLYCLCVVFMGFEGEINGYKGGWVMVLWLVKFNFVRDLWF